jgi:hypothetical protein
MGPAIRFVLRRVVVVGKARQGSCRSSARAAVASGLARLLGGVAAATHGTGQGNGLAR